jgi:hypothetical protein
LGFNTPYVESEGISDALQILGLADRIATIDRKLDGMSVYLIESHI